MKGQLISFRHRRVFVLLPRCLGAAEGKRNLNRNAWPWVQDLDDQPNYILLYECSACFERHISTSLARCLHCCPHRLGMAVVPFLPQEDSRAYCQNARGWVTAVLDLLTGRHTESHTRRKSLACFSRKSMDLAILFAAFGEEHSYNSLLSGVERTIVLAPCAFTRSSKASLAVEQVIIPCLNMPPYPFWRTFAIFGTAKIIHLGIPQST